MPTRGLGWNPSAFAIRGDRGRHDPQSHQPRRCQHLDRAHELAARPCAAHNGSSGPLVYLTELSLAVTLILGFLVRPMGVVGMLFVTHLWLGLYRQPEEWPWLYVFLIFVQGLFVVTDAGKSLGLDAVIARKPFGPFAGNGLPARMYR